MTGKFQTLESRRRLSEGGEWVERRGERMVYYLKAVACALLGSSGELSLQPL
jgi:hypothetical protein